MDNMQIYNMSREVPKEALRPITSGRLKGKSDINPVWRIAKLTEIFGPCGIGWKYIITRREMVPGANGEIACFVDIDLFYKWEGEWSEAVPGTGGSSYVARESKGLYVSDECYKMALTDALSVACKALGIGANVYWEAGRSKYTGNPEPEQPRLPQQPQPEFIPHKPKFTPPDIAFRCDQCGEELKVYKDANGKEVGLRKHAEGSKNKFGRVLCLDCIARLQHEQLEAEAAMAADRE